MPGWLVAGFVVWVLYGAPTTARWLVAGCILVVAELLRLLRLWIERRR